VVAFDTVLHPAIGRARGLRDFMVRVDRDVPADAVLYVFKPVDPGLRFYAPRALEAWSVGAEVPGTRWVLMWEDEAARWRTVDGAPLRPVDVSLARDDRRGALVLVEVGDEGMERAP
jgi:hypothetical protein